MEKTTVHDNLHTEVMENVIYIQMLGGFSMTYHGSRFCWARASAVKCSIC